jgi:Tfp pilus assembly protein PilO
MEGVLAVVLIFGGGTLFLLAVSPIGRAIAERIRGRTQATGDPGTQEELQAELQEVRRELAEMVERMDFMERMLAKARDAERLAPPQR